MLTRRLFLKSAGIAGCSAAAHPLLTAVTFAAAPGENRLVVIVLRGALDGLAALQPYGDPLLKAYRPNLPAGPDGGATDIDGFWAVHAGLSDLVPLWQAGELAFAPAVSTPYRGRRSHFEGQDILEAGTGPDAPPALAREGWLNRLVQVMPGSTAETAYSVGIEDMRILAGAAKTSSWAPAAELEISPQALLLLDHVYHDDPLFRDAGMLAAEIDAEMDGGGMMATPRAGRGRAGAVKALADFTAARLREETRIASFSLNGWDTHRAQERALGGSFGALATAILALREGLGPVWDKTLVMAVTEFGRTVRENGTQGTDHGTGGLALMAGGAVRGGRIFGRWPGLAEAELYEGRDLMPTGDVRAYAAWAMRGLFGTSDADLAGTVFPGLDLGSDPGIVA